MSVMWYDHTGVYLLDSRYKTPWYSLVNQDGEKHSSREEQRSSAQNTMQVCASYLKTPQWQ